MSKEQDIIDDIEEFGCSPADYIEKLETNIRTSAEAIHIVKNEILPFFECNIFTDRNDAVTFIKEKFEKNLKVLTYGNQRSSRVIHLRCSNKNCFFEINCSFKQNKNDFPNKQQYFQFNKDSSCLTHGILDEFGNIEGICNGKKRKLSTVKSLY